jgi:salicylate hydroxylase
LRAYERLRLERTSETQASSRLNQHIFHLKDGQEQELRDRNMIAAMVSSRIAAGMPLEGLLLLADGSTCENGNKGNPNQWADQTKNFKQFSHDADAEAEIWWREEGHKLLAHSAVSH